MDLCLDGPELSSSFDIFKLQPLQPVAVEIITFVFVLFIRLFSPCIRLARGKFELTNQDAAGGKNSSVLAPVVQRLDNAIHRINHYPVDKR